MTGTAGPILQSREQHDLTLNFANSFLISRRVRSCLNFFSENSDMEKGVFSRDAVLVLAACFCFMSCHTMIIPVLAGFTGSLGGSSLLMGTIVGITNLFR